MVKRLVSKSVLMVFEVVGSCRLKKKSSLFNFNSYDSFAGNTWFCRYKIAAAGIRPTMAGSLYEE